MACKMMNLQLKIDRYAEVSNLKMTKIQQSFSLYRQNPAMVTEKKASFQVANTPEIKANVESIRYMAESFNKQLGNFKGKEFKYENSNVLVIKDRINYLTSAVTAMEKER